MFSSEFGEKDKSRVELRGVEAGAMQLVLGWVYTGGSVHITVDNAESLLQAASLLQMTRLTEVCFLKDGANNIKFYSKYFSRFVVISCSPSWTWSTASRSRSLRVCTAATNWSPPPRSSRGKHLKVFLMETNLRY